MHLGLGASMQPQLATHCDDTCKNALQSTIPQHREASMLTAAVGHWQSPLHNTKQPQYTPHARPQGSNFTWCKTLAASSRLLATMRLLINPLGLVSLRLAVILPTLLLCLCLILLCLLDTWTGLRPHTKHLLDTLCCAVTGDCGIGVSID